MKDLAAQMERTWKALADLPDSSPMLCCLPPAVASGCQRQGIDPMEVLSQYGFTGWEVSKPIPTTTPTDGG